HGPRTPGDFPFEIGRVEGPGNRIDIPEDGCRAAIQDRVCACDHREVRDYDLVPRTDSEGREGEMKCGRAARRGDPLASPDVARERLLEVGEELPPGGDPSGPERRWHKRGARRADGGGGRRSRAHARTDWRL